MIDNTIHVCCSTDDKYAQICCVMLCSIFENNKKNKILVHILISHLSDENRRIFINLSERYDTIIELHTVNDSILNGVKFNNSRKLSISAYYRILLSSILAKDVTKVLYFDCDMLVLEDLLEIYNLDLQDYAIAAVEDAWPIKEEHRMQILLSYSERYFNSGFLVINLDYWRNHDIESQLLAFAKRERYVYFHDQDALNRVLGRHCFFLPLRWNCFSVAYRSYKQFILYYDWIQYKRNPAIIHFTLIRPWCNLYSPYKRLYYEYVKKTGIQGFKVDRYPVLKGYYCIFSNMIKRMFASFLMFILKYVR